MKRLISKFARIERAAFRYYTMFVLTMVIAALAVLLCLSVTSAFADITYHGTTGQTLYARIQTGASTFEGVAMTEGSSGGLGVYRTADSALVSAGVTTPSAVAGFPGGYPFTIRSGAASDTANDTILASGQLIWSGQGELPSNDVLWRSTVSAVNSQTDLELAAIPNDVTWLGCTILVRDASVAGATMTGTVTGVATGAVQFAAHGSAPFTIATSDIVEILPPAYGSSDRSVDTAIKTKTDYLPSATAGASGGLVIAGTNAPITFTGSGAAMSLISTGGNGAGLLAAGNGSGSGVSGVGGATGHGMILARGGSGADDLNFANNDAPGIQSEVQDAIEANHLDHLLAAAYDPTSKPGHASSLFNAMIENDGGVPQFTANALEESPSGGGATAEEIAEAVFEADPADYDTDPLSFAGRITGAPTLEEAAAEIGEEIATASSVSPFLVDEDHTWDFQSRSQITSPQLITEAKGAAEPFLVSMRFTNPMPARAVIASVISVSVADESGKTEPTLGTAQISADRKEVHIPVTATSASAGTYTVSATIETTDSQQFIRRGRLVLQ